MRHDEEVTRIGICEDDESVRRVLTDAFKMHGHEVVIARNGQEALRNLAVGAGLDVLVIDIGLPDADGRDVCQALRTEGQHAPCCSSPRSTPSTTGCRASTRAVTTTCRSRSPSPR